MAAAEAQIAKVRDTSRRYHYLGTSDEEIVMSRDSFPAKSFGEIYHLRRRIETAYQILKDRLQMENFTGIFLYCVSLPDV